MVHSIASLGMQSRFSSSAYSCVRSILYSVIVIFLTGLSNNITPVIVDESDGSVIIFDDMLPLSLFV